MMMPVKVLIPKQVVKRIYSAIRNNRAVDGIFDQLSGIKDIYGKVNYLVQSLGVRRFLTKMLYSRHEEIVLGKDLDTFAYAPSKCTLSVLSIEKEHLPKLALLRKQAGFEGSDPTAGLSEYLNDGCKGLMAEHEGEIIGYIWWGDSKSGFAFYPRSNRYLIKEIITSGGADIYGFDFFIAPQYRGGGSAKEFFNKYLQVLKDLGYSKPCGCVRSDNIAARWIYKTAGCKETKRIVVRRFLLFFLFKGSKCFLDNGIKWMFDTREIYKGQKGFRT